jgi:hypothetical protein
MAWSLVSWYMAAFPVVSLPRRCIISDAEAAVTIVHNARMHAEAIVCRKPVEEAERHNTPSSADNLQAGDLVLVWR